jgi:hypothetical protein
MTPKGRLEAGMFVPVMSVEVDVKTGFNECREIRDAVRIGTAGEHDIAPKISLVCRAGMLREVNLRGIRKG